jgi:hypothetical protein
VSVDTISQEPKNRIVRLANGGRIGRIGDQVTFEAGIPLFYPDPRETAVVKTGVLFISMDFRSSEKRFAIQ